MWENKPLKKGVASLRESVVLLDEPTDRVRLLASHWSRYPETEWAESAIDMLIAR